MLLLSLPVVLAAVTAAVAYFVYSDAAFVAI